MIECPHCHTVVLPTTSGACPSCMKDTREAPAVRTSKIPIRRKCVMPEVCYQCGEYARRSVKVAFTEPRECGEFEDDGGPGALMILSVLFGFISFFIVLFFNLIRALAGQLIRSAADRDATLSFRIRQCRDCAKKRGSANPHHVWFEHNEMDFVVHPRFAEEFAISNLEFDAEAGGWRTDA